MAQFSTATAPALHVSRPLVDRGCMTMTLAYAIALAEARTCVAALADTASAFEESIRYEHLLYDLDALHPIGPTLYATTGTKPDLLGRLETFVDQMLDLGDGDGLSLELLLVAARVGS